MTLRERWKNLQRFRSIYLGQNTNKAVLRSPSSQPSLLLHIHNAAKKSKRRISPSIPQTVQRRVYNKRGLSLSTISPSSAPTTAHPLQNMQRIKGPSPVNNNLHRPPPPIDLHIQKATHNKLYAKTSSPPGDSNTKQQASTPVENKKTGYRRIEQQVRIAK